MLGIERINGAKIGTKAMKCSTWNVLSWYRPGVATTTLKSVDMYRMEVSTIQEVRWPDLGKIKMGNHINFYSGQESQHAKKTILLSLRVEY